VHEFDWRPPLHHTHTHTHTFIPFVLRRTLWAWIGGRLREYELDGRLLRSIKPDSLSLLGIYGVSSIAWVRPHKLILSMRLGNRIAYIDTAPDPPTSEDDGSMGFEEPPGPEEELRMIRERNLVTLVSMLRVPASLLPKNALGPISYNRARDTIIFTSTRGPSAGVMELSLDSGGDHAPASRLSRVAPGA